jgi:hypothetical protein
VRRLGKVRNPDAPEATRIMEWEQWGSSMGAKFRFGTMICICDQCGRHRLFPAPSQWDVRRATFTRASEAGWLIEQVGQRQWSARCPECHGGYDGADTTEARELVRHHGDKEET